MACGGGFTFTCFPHPERLRFIILIGWVFGNGFLKNGLAPGTRILRRLGVCEPELSVIESSVAKILYFLPLRQTGCVAAILFRQVSQYGHTRSSSSRDTRGREPKVRVVVTTWEVLAGRKCLAHCGPGTQRVPHRWSTLPYFRPLQIYNYMCCRYCFDWFRCLIDDLHAGKYNSTGR